MKSLGFKAAIVLTALVSAKISLAEPVGDAGDVKSLIAIEDEVSGQSSIDTVMRHFALDAVLIDLAAPDWHVGRDAITAIYRDRLEAQHGARYHVDAVNVVSDGTMACVATQVHFYEQASGRPSLTVRRLDAFRKIDGEWRIIQQHLGIPASETSGLSATGAAIPARGEMHWSRKPFFDSLSVTPEVAREEIRQWTDVMAVPSTTNEAVAYYGPFDDEILYSPFLPGEHRGLAELRAYMGPMMAGIRNLEVKIWAFKDDSDGKFGVQISQQTLTLNKADGSSAKMSFRQSDCLRRVDGKWFSFFELGTVPVDQTTAKLLVAQSTKP